MKISTLMLAGLMTLTSVAAFAEGGAERSRQFYKDFNFVQSQTHGTNQQTAAADGKSPKTSPAEQTDTEQPNT